MGKLLAVVLIAAAAYGGYWFVGAAAVENGLRGWLGQQADRGWSVTYSDLSTRGFPSRFDTTITDPALRDPASGWGWRAPFFQILALSYRPTQIIAAFPNSQTILTPTQEVALDSATMRASATFAANTGLALDHSAVVADDVTLTGADWSAAMAQLRLATRPAVGLEHGHDVDLVALDLRPDRALRDLMDPAGDLPGTLDALRIDATLGFDGPLDRFALTAGGPGIRTIAITEARVAWGPLALRISGDLAVGPAGLPEGRLILGADGWRRMVAMAVDAGAIPPGAADTALNALGMLAGGADAGATLEVPLVFAGGRVAVGPVDLGPAPRFTPPVAR